MKLYGYTGKILRVDLSCSKVTYEDLDEATARNYLGGTGLGLKYLYDEVPAGVEWSDEHNRLMICSGPLGATKIPGSGTISLVTKGPLTNGATASQANGYFGAFLRTSGFDGVIVQGKSDGWVYLHIHDGIAEIKDAAHLAGKDTWETSELIKTENGKKERQMSVACIGPSGENLVKFACTVVDGDHVASKNGNGAVLGAKMLKAIAVDRGKGRPLLADEGTLNGLAKEFHDEIDFTQFGNGTAAIFDGGGLAQGGNCIMYNYSKLYDPDPALIEKLAKFGSTYMRDKHQAKRDPCWACNATHCHALTLSEGDYAGEKVNEPEYEALVAFGPLIGNFTSDAAIYLSTYADRLGIDANEAGWVLAMVIECYENGILNSEDTNGIEMRWGDYQAVQRMMDKIAQRDGFGDLLAEGTLRAAQAIGDEALNRAIFVTGGSTPRGVPFKKSWATMLDYCVGQGGTNEGMAEIPDPEAVGIECSIGANYRGMETTKEQAIEFNVSLGWGLHFNDCLGICYFPTAVDMERLRQAICAATGWDYSIDEVVKLGRRIQNLLRAFNVKHGHTRAGDYPSPRMTSPVELPEVAALPIEDMRPLYDDILDQYYEGMGWDKTTTKPLPETLNNLGLDYVVPDLWQDTANSQ